MNAGSVEVVDIGRMSAEVEEATEVVVEDTDEEAIPEIVVDLHQGAEEAAEAIQEILIEGKADVMVVKKRDTSERNVLTGEVEILVLLIEDERTEDQTVVVTNTEMLPAEEKFQEADHREKDALLAEIMEIAHLETHQELDLHRGITINATTTEVPHAENNVTSESTVS